MKITKTPWIILALILSPLALESAPKLIIAIIDTGVDLKNETIRNYLWKNPGETGVDIKGHDKSKNKIDDDGNGLIDDISGWSYFNDSNDLQDHHGHGTHIAGLIIENLRQLGLKDQFELMILKYYESDSQINNLLAHSNKAFAYSYNKKANLINYSGGGYSPSSEEKKYLELLNANNVPVIAAIGNQGLNADRAPFYPAAYDLDNIFSIGASGNNLELTEFSNYGSQTLDFISPGYQVDSLGLNGTRKKLSGTSQSTAIATAWISYLLWQKQFPPDWSKIKDDIKQLKLKFDSSSKTKSHQLLIDTEFIKRHKSAQLDAFGDPI